jgi:hypothetical protein
MVPSKFTPNLLSVNASTRTPPIRAKTGVI